MERIPTEEVEEVEEAAAPAPPTRSPAYLVVLAILLIPIVTFLMFYLLFLVFEEEIREWISDNSTVPMDPPSSDASVMLMWFWNNATSFSNDSLSQ